MKLEDSSPCSQMPTIGPYPEGSCTYHIE